ncbi:bifunctional aspartate kinase/homoserine dehydrogenase I [Flavihumibacter stibioxidans]|uniref:Bifunctional aspartate kinase/homoserine dehydrogenase I n=1 Tax=Flavihumibacter stibioxidans TaxID=1834163 RepID=A0ABR7M565_9BACT|nr:bifunctional aspartate kinase/homoserine dehydrogenase I [Flavihumibacter stibioxidans]MBC6490158.1 bifunctional aspartate kinase/homoserine dehydrogenase I [Flavihumibacter stibioxidans]
MQVIKFGGTSVGSPEAILQVIEIVAEKIKQEPVITIVSAFGGTTDALLQCGALAAGGNELYKEQVNNITNRHLNAVKQLIPVQQQSSLLSAVKKLCNEVEDLCNGIFLLGETTARTKDKLVSYGELISSQIINAAFQARGVKSTWWDSRKLIRTNSEFGNAVVDFPKTGEQFSAARKELSTSLVLMPGFVASDAAGTTTTLGRGGSDYTAAIAAAALDASKLEIWTDVSGMMTADPRWVPNAKVIPSISYQEAMELSHFGAKVIYPPTIQPVMNKHIPVWIKNTFAPADPGTVIELDGFRNGNPVRGISSINNLALLSLEGSGMIGVPGFSRRLFEALSSQQINVILITQGSSEHSICVGVDVLSAEKAKQAVDAAFEPEITLQKVDPLIVEKDLSIVALVGEQMKSHPGISGKMFGALGRNGVNVRAIAQGSSERNISAVISTRDVRKAINLLHEEFFETTNKQVNLFITGVGNVGSRLLQQLAQQQQYLLQHNKLQLRVVGLANSKKYVISEEGLDLQNWKTELENGSDGDIASFTDGIIQRNLRNTVFVDITASEIVARIYPKLLEKSIAVVACNKIACSSPYVYYRELKDKAHAFNTSFLFETNVGAGLPIIGTLNDLLKSGDQVHRIEAVLSGTLNFVFNNYDGSRPFAEVVRQAQDEGYTEPDPRLDLSGTDVMRKIMILAREAGETIEMEAISNNSFLPESCMKGTVDDFYREMLNQEAHFKAIYDEAAANGNKLKFVASFNNGRAAVGLRQIAPGHDLYHLYGKDNIILFYTERYPEQPLVIKGAGAGADVTASGVFADILRATLN